MTGMLADEGPRMPERFVTHGLSRLAAWKHSKAIITGNPEGPTHWCYLKFACDEDGNEYGPPRHFAFTPADNPTLHEGWVDDMRNVYDGHDYSRMVLGLHVAADGAIYPNLRESLVKNYMLLGRPRRYIIAGDFASATVSHCVKIAEFANKKACVMAEWYHDARSSSVWTEDKQAEKMLEKLDPNGEVSHIIIDKAAVGFRKAISERSKAKVVASRCEGTKKTVGPGIKAVRLSLGKNLFIDKGKCSKLIGSMSGYQYDPNASKKGEDVPLKDGNEHGADAVRYYKYAPRTSGLRIIDVAT